MNNEGEDMRSLSPESENHRSVASVPRRERLITRLTLTLRWLFDRLAGGAAIPPTPAAVRRVVIVKPCCLGDVLMATPLVAAVRVGYPQAEITFAVSSYARAAIAGNPAIDRLLDMGGVGAGRLSFGPALVGSLRFWLALRRGRYDLCIVLDRSPILATLPWLAGIRHRAGIDSAGRGFALTMRVPWSDDDHECDLYLKVATALGLSIAGVRMSFVPPPAAQSNLEKRWSSLALPPSVPVHFSIASTPAPKNIIALAPGGGVNPGMVLTAKRWPLDRYSELTVRLLEHNPAAHVVVIGDKHDSPLAAQLRDSLPEPLRDRLHDVTGKLSFAETGALLARCTLFVGNDSAPMHLATATGIPTIGLFGPTSPQLYRPWNPDAQAIWLGLECSPCFVHGHMPPCPFAFRCLTTLSVETVWQACRPILHKQEYPQIAALGGAAGVLPSALSAEQIDDFVEEEHLSDVQHKISVDRNTP